MHSFTLSIWKDKRMELSADLKLCFHPSNKIVNSLTPGPVYFPRDPATDGHAVESQSMRSLHALR